MAKNTTKTASKKASGSVPSVKGNGNRASAPQNDEQAREQRRQEHEDYLAQRRVEHARELEELTATMVPRVVGFFDPDDPANQRFLALDDDEAKTLIEPVRRAMKARQKG